MARKRAPKPQRTYQARLKALPEGEAALLDAYAALYSQAERRLLADWVRGERLAGLKPVYQRQYGLTARQFNAIRRGLEGRIESVQEQRSTLIAQKKRALRKTERLIAKLQQKQEQASGEQRRKLRQRLHQKKRRLQTQKDRLASLEADHRAGRVRLCFGSRKRFHAQFDLAANGHADHAAWRADWRRARDSQFFVLGSGDETAGCQGCQAQYRGGQRFAFRLRLPNALVERNGGHKYVAFEVDLPYGADHLAAALERGQAISYRFQRDAKGWRVFATTEALPFERRSDRRLGVIGVDLNTDHLAVAATDRHGNPVATRRIPLVLYGCTSEQAKARIGEAVKALMAFAGEQGKPIAVERLDFEAKKARLEGEGVRYSRMLSAFAYGRLLANLKARAHDHGIEVLERNPAYTSVIGAWKFAERYGISSHQAAALVIARRAMNLSERPNRRDHNALLLPVRNRSRHVWSFWKQVARGGAAHAAPGRSAQGRSRPSPARDPGQARSVTPPSGAGEIPAREPLPSPFG